MLKVRIYDYFTEGGAFFFHRSTGPKHFYGSRDKSVFVIYLFFLEIVGDFSFNT